MPAMLALHGVVMVPIPFPSLVSIFLPPDSLGSFCYNGITRDWDPINKQTEHALFKSGPRSEPACFVGKCRTFSWRTLMLRANRNFSIIGNNYNFWHKNLICAFIIYLEKLMVPLFFFKTKSKWYHMIYICIFFL